MIESVTNFFWTGDIGNEEVASIIDSADGGAAAAVEDMEPIEEAAAEDAGEVVIEELVADDWAIFAEYAAEFLLEYGWMLLFAA